jgi:hypothetical protein
MQELDEVYEGEYRVVRSPINRGGAAILYFGFLVLIPDVIWELTSETVHTTLTVLMILVLVGLLFALSALRSDHAKLPAKIAVLLHIGGVLWITVPVAGFFWVLNS